MARAVVVFDSKYGNTERVARALAAGLREGGVPTDCLRCRDVPADRLATYDLLVVGGPTHYGAVSKPVADFLARLSGTDLRGKKAFAFDTRYADPMAGSAAKEIEKLLRERNAAILRPHASAIVLGGEGPLEERAEETFRRIGEELAQALG